MSTSKYRVKLLMLLTAGLATGCGGGGGSAPQPDLTVSLSSSSPASVVPNSTISVNGLVTNSGQGNATTAISVGVYLSTDSTIDTSDTLIGTINGPASLDSSNSSNVSGMLTVPNTTSGGNYSVGLIVDPQNTIAESNETNNTSSVSPLAVVSCSGSTTSNVLVSWTANKEVAVNTTNGGYRVYYSPVSGFAISDAGVTMVDVPYVSGSTSPTSTTLSLTPCLYYIKVAGYSALGGGTSGDLSTEVSVAVP